VIRTGTAILLFLLNLSRAGERAGHSAERPDARKRNDAIYLNATRCRPTDRDILADRLRDGQF
jgi:hypothetical protein